MIAENTAKMVGNGGRYCKKDLYDILNNKIQTEQRTGREIVTELASKMGLEVIADGIA